jgi:hypothetical protein
MKNKMLIVLCILGFLPFYQSCKNDQVVNPDTNTINATIKPGETYQYDLGYFGDEEGAHISKQAIHAQLSNIERAPDFGKVIYTYQSEANYIGTDEVEIKSERGSDGASPNDKIITTLIKFTIKK